MKKLIIILSIFLASTAMAADRTETIEFLWQQADLEHIQGWELYWGDEPGVYDENPRLTIEYMGEELHEYSSGGAQFTVSGNPGEVVTKYFSMKAVSKTGAKSGFSNEVSHTFKIPMSPPFRLIIRINTEAK